MAIPSALVQPLIGDFAGKEVAKYQPAKLAAMEALEHTQAHAPEHIGPIEIPGMVSWLATGDADATVQGLDAFPPDDRPPAVIRPAFQIMVALGMAMALYAALALWRAWRGTWASGRWWLLATIALGPAGVLATEAGWMVTELGRQPWVIYGVLRTEAAATPLTAMWIPLATFAVVYLGLAAVVITVLVRQVREATEQR
jgi:cytochrome d ubiquinol oxidase subunit I